VSACEVKFDLTKKLEAKSNDGVEHEEFLRLLWCHSSTSLPNKGKTWFWFFNKGLLCSCISVLV